MIVKPKEKKFVKIKALFIDEISACAIVKMIDNEVWCTVVLKLKFVRNCASKDGDRYRCHRQNTILY